MGNNLFMITNSQPNFFLKDKDFYRIFVYICNILLCINKQCKKVTHLWTYQYNKSKC